MSFLFFRQGHTAPIAQTLMFQRQPPDFIFLPTPPAHLIHPFIRVGTRAMNAFPLQEPVGFADPEHAPAILAHDKLPAVQRQEHTTSRTHTLLLLGFGLPSLRPLALLYSTMFTHLERLGPNLCKVLLASVAPGGGVFSKVFRKAVFVYIYLCLILWPQDHHVCFA